MVHFEKLPVVSFSVYKEVLIEFFSDFQVVKNG